LLFCSFIVATFMPLLMFKLEKRVFLKN